MKKNTYKFRLDKIMVDKKITVRALGTLSGVGTATISRMMNNHTCAVSLEVMSRLCAALGVHPGDLFEEEFQNSEQE